MDFVTLLDATDFAEFRGGSIMCFCLFFLCAAFVDSDAYRTRDIETKIIQREEIRKDSEMCNRHDYVID